jgi:tetratricopeptide (TPR) repeat protein
MHLHPSGKPETVQPEIAFYFTDRTPTNSAIRINLNPLDIDIPAGTNDYLVEDKFVLPSDVDLVRLSPHAHYLCKRMEGYAILPDGRREDLLLITNWDFNWQNDYRYAKPIFLPKGTTLAMKYSYDNSSANERNPFNPPRRVRYGSQTTDEMAELWLQVLPRNPSPAERNTLGRAIYEHMARLSIDHYEHVLLENPKDAVAHARAGTAEHYFGQTDRALAHFRSAVQANPNYDEAWYELGFLCLRQNRLDEAQNAFENVVRLNPDDYQAEGSLGSLYYQKGDLEKAEKHLKSALIINPGDAIARQNLALVQAAKSGSRK